VDQWKHHLIYHQLAAKVNWHGCKSGQSAQIHTIVDIICQDPNKRCSMIKDCERNSAFRRKCQKDAMGRAPDIWEERLYPGISFRRCPACLKAVPRQAVQCLQCWGHLLTEDGIAEITDNQSAETERKEVEMITPERRTAHDIEIMIDDEAIQFPCIDVSRFCERFEVANKRSAAMGVQEEDPDRPRGTVEMIASIQSLFWSKYHKKAYEYEFPEDPRAVTIDANFSKIQMFLQHRLEAWGSSLEQVFCTQSCGGIGTKSSCQFRLPWRRFNDKLLPAFTRRVTAWGDVASNWATAYHGT